MPRAAPLSAGGSTSAPYCQGGNRRAAPEPVGLSMACALRHLSPPDSASTDGAAAQGLAVSRSSSYRPPRAASSTCGHQLQLLPRRGHHNPRQEWSSLSRASATGDSIPDTAIYLGATLPASHYSR